MIRLAVGHIIKGGVDLFFQSSYMHKSVAMGSNYQAKYLLLAFISVVAIVLAAPNNCSIQYQAALQEVLDLKKSCHDAVIKDCCEVWECDLEVCNRPQCWYILPADFCRN